MRTSVLGSLVTAALLCVAGSAGAVTISQTLGTPEFADGESPISAAAFLASPDPAPYNEISGSDPGGTFGDITLLHDLGPIADPIVSAVFTIGLVDHDSFDLGSDTIDIFFDGLQQDDSGFLGISIAQSSASIVSMAVAGNLVVDGLLEIRIVATQASPRAIGNGFGVDFSTLTVETGAAGPTPVPEPSAALTFVVGIAIVSSARGRA